jgi:hypothetical protein
MAPTPVVPMLKVKWVAKPVITKSVAAPSGFMLSTVTFEPLQAASASGRAANDAMRAAVTIAQRAPRITAVSMAPLVRLIS